MRLIGFFGSVALAAIMLGTASDLFAQENGNRDENNKIVRGPYETNGFGGNWFVGVGGGINTFVDGGYKPGIGGALDVNVGKWFTPSVGARFGYQGLTFSEWAPNASILGPTLDESKNMYKRNEGFAYIHADLMWNISNAFSGYKETRFWNVIPYAHGGVFRGYGANGIKYGNNEFAAGAGLLNNLRISDRLNFTIDLRGTIVKGDIHEAKGGLSGMASALFGISVNLGKTNWKRAVNVPAGYAPYRVESIDDLNDTAAKLKEANRTLEQKNTGLAQENAALKQEIEALKKENEALKAKSVCVTPGAVFFNIGQTELDERELFHLDFYVKTCIEQDADKVFVITGYADKQTGSKKRNQYLSEKRVEYVYGLLKDKYNIPAERLVVKAAGSETSRFNSPVLDRAVVLE